MILLAPSTGSSSGLTNAWFANDHHFINRLNSGISGPEDSERCAHQSPQQLEHVVPACQVEQIPFAVLHEVDTSALLESGIAGCCLCRSTC